MSRHEQEAPWSPVVAVRLRRAATVMSRHGMIPPAQRFPAPRGPRTPAETLLAVLRVLLQEAAFGFLLWSSTAPEKAIQVAASLVGLCAIILWTRRFGVLRALSWATSSWEGLLIYIGAVAIGNLLSLCLGVAPWWR